MDVRQKIAEQLGLLILANIEQAAEIERLVSKLEEIGERGGKDDPAVQSRVEATN